MELNKKIVNFESMNENTKLTLAEALLYTKGLAGGYGGDFPLSTASKDSIYRVPATNKFYVCTENYNGSQISAPNSNFVELSVWKNHDRLNNLIISDNFPVKIAFKSYSWFSSGAQSTKEVTIPIDIDYKKVLFLSVRGTNGKLPLTVQVKNKAIYLGENNYWLYPQNDGTGYVDIIFSI